MAYLNRETYPSVEEEYPLNDDLERFYTHLETTLEGTSFIRKSHPGVVMTKLRRLFNRARPESQELNILRGILASIDKSVKNANSGDAGPASAIEEKE
jgi:tRNA (cytidine32/uridine32-2'-O)-methyltransferase